MSSEETPTEEGLGYRKDYYGGGFPPRGWKPKENTPKNEFGYSDGGFPSQASSVDNYLPATATAVTTANSAPLSNPEATQRLLTLASIYGVAALLKAGLLPDPLSRPQASAELKHLQGTDRQLVLDFIDATSGGTPDAVRKFHQRVANEAARQVPTQPLPTHYHLRGYVQSKVAPSLQAPPTDEEKKKYEAMVTKYKDFDFSTRYSKGPIVKGLREAMGGSARYPEEQKGLEHHVISMPKAAAFIASTTYKGSMRPGNSGLDCMADVEIVRQAIKDMASQGSVDKGRLKVLDQAVPRVDLARRLAGPSISRIGNIRDEESSLSHIAQGYRVELPRSQVNGAIAKFLLSCTDFPMTEKEAKHLVDSTIAAPSLTAYNYFPGELKVWQRMSEEAFNAACENSLLPYQSARLVATALDNKFRYIEAGNPRWGQSGLSGVKFQELPSVN